MLARNWPYDTMTYRHLKTTIVQLRFKYLAIRRATYL